MNANNTKKSPIHQKADANITCDFDEGDITRYMSRFRSEGGMEGEREGGKERRRPIERWR